MTKGVIRFEMKCCELIPKSERVMTSSEKNGEHQCGEVFSRRIQSDAFLKSCAKRMLMQLLHAKEFGRLIVIFYVNVHLKIV